MKTNLLPSNPQTSEEILRDLHEIVAHTERHFGATLDACAKETSANLMARLDTAQKCLTELFADAATTVSNRTKRADKVIRSHPYEALAVALGAGTLIAILLSRKTDPAGR